MQTTERVLDISDSPVRMHVRYGQLLIDSDAGQHSVPLTDLAVLIVAHPQALFTSAVLAGIIETGGAVIVCNEKRMPTGTLIPIEGHYVQAERIAAQASAPLPLRKRLWKQIVRAKLRAQSAALEAAGAEGGGIAELAKQVRSGDPENVEAQAARRYWRLLFGDRFRRAADGGDILDARNGMLNYGYAVLRAMTARAVCAAGLHPSLGLHHHNRYDAYCLADDLMEPFRPAVDLAVHAAFPDRDDEARLDRSVKSVIIKSLTEYRCVLESEERSLFDALGRLSSSLAACYLRKAKQVALPEF